MRTTVLRQPLFRSWPSFTNAKLFILNHAKEEEDEDEDKLWVYAEIWAARRFTEFGFRF